MQYDKRAWWMHEDPKDRASEMEALIGALDIYQNGRSYDLLRYMSMYANRDLVSMSRASTDPYLPQMPQQIINTSASILAMFVAEHVEAETKPTFDVDDGDWEARHKAEQLDKFVWGEIYRLKIQQMTRMGLRDAGIAGDGWVKFFAKDGKVAAERVLPLEILIDEASAMSGPNQEMYQRRYVSRSYALEMWPEHEEKIMMLPAMQAPYMWPGTDSDMVCITEGWHLPQHDGDSGCHVLSCGGIVLNEDDQEWKHKSFPFARMMWEPAQMGAYSQGLIEILAPLQLELNKTAKRIQHSLHLMSVPRVWQNSATKVGVEYDNMVGNVYKYTGPKPETEVAQANSPEMYNRENTLRERMYELARANPVRSGQATPSRVDSRPGMREWVATADSANAWLGKMWEDFMLQCAEQIIRVARDIVKTEGSYKAFGRAKDFVQKIDFGKIDLEDDRFVIKLENTNLLPTTITGKRMAFMEMMQLPQFQDDPTAVLEMMGDHPDLKALVKQKNIARTLVEKQMYMICARKKYFGPEQYQNLHLAKQIAQETWQEVYMDSLGKNTEVLNMLQTYLEDCDTILQMIEPPALPAPGGVPPNGVANGSPVPGPIPGQPPVPGAPGPGGPPVG